MRDDLRATITRRLVAEYEFKDRGNGWLQSGRCPECGKKELYAKADAPWLITCGRTNKCGAQLHVKALYPDLFANWSTRYKVSKASPHAAADGYLREGRGFDLKRLKGTYTQESYVDHDKKLSTATVRFALDGGSWWERLIDDPERFGTMKARFAPGKSRRGVWWQLPDSEPMPETLWLAEGIFDAIALELNGIAARALLSSNNYPASALAALAEQCHQAGCKRPVLVWALDHDESGQRYTHKWLKQARKDGWVCKAAQIPPPPRGKLDWNDLHQLGKLDKRDIEEYLHHGALLMARSAADKAALLFNRKRRWQFHFEYERRLYWFKLERPSKIKGDEIDLREIDIDDFDANTVQKLDCVREIANCVPQVLYYQANKITDEAWYYFKIESPHFPRPLKATFTAGQHAVAAEFKKRLMHVAPGALWTGTQRQLDQLLRDNDRVLNIEAIDYIGYSREHGCYVFGDLAMQGGKLARRNQDDYFELGKLNLKSISQSVNLKINAERDHDCNEWVELLWRCFGAKGLVALTFWFGSLFAEQIRAQDESWPFLEIVGEPGSGKSTLVEFLWKLLGRSNYEGFDPTKATLSARARNFAQVSNLPVVLIESERGSGSPHHQKSFDWDELKTAYNGRSVRARGMKNSGNETYEPPFRASIVIAQNYPVEADEAIIQRIVHVEFDKTQHSRESKPLAERLARMPMEAVSGFILKATAAEKQVMETMQRQRIEYENRLLDREDIRSQRIAKNHAQLMALADALAAVIGLGKERLRAVQAQLEQMAVQRQQAINLDHPMIEAFWEQFEYLDGRALKNGELIELDHTPGDAHQMAINLVEYEAACTRAGIHPPCEMAQLKKLLKSSRRRQYLTMKPIHSTRTGRTVRCWLFRVKV